MLKEKILLTFNIEENEDAYISPYSLFMLENFDIIMNRAQYVCDYGAGTGVLGMMASLYPIKEISFIEINPKTFELLKNNCGQLKNTTMYLYRQAQKCNKQFDTILCNPASLPNFLNVNSFCDGGELGLDMINEVVDFSAKSLLPDGALYIIITSILPISLVTKRMESLHLKYSVVASIDIPFRSHYAGIVEWVNKLKKEYNEMEYYTVQGKNYERLYLYEIKRSMYYYETKI